MYLMSCNDLKWFSLCYLTVHNLDNNFFLMKSALIIIKFCHKNDGAQLSLSCDCACGHEHTFIGFIILWCTLIRFYSDMQFWYQAI